MIPAREDLLEFHAVAQVRDVSIMKTLGLACESLVMCIHEFGQSCVGLFD